jgi:hypothetical protein
MRAIPATLAFGVPAWPSTGGGWDPWLAVTIVLAVLSLPRLLRTRITVPLVIGALVAGLLLATALEAWGIPVAAGLGMAFAIALSGVAAARRRRGPPV